MEIYLEMKRKKKKKKKKKKKSNPSYFKRKDLASMQVVSPCSRAAF